MTYYKNMSGDGLFVLSISTNAGEIGISAAEYNEIMAIIRNAPKAQDGYAYKLRADDLTWELVELPPEPDDPTVEDKAEAYDILMGVEQ